MPEFVLDHGTAEASQQFAALDDFTQGYIEAAFFVSTGYAEDEDLESATLAELAPEALAAMVADCQKFQALNAELLILACNSNLSEEYDRTRAGHDFWYTRNGHGVGYWDRDLEDVGDKLTAACGWQTSFGEVWMYRGDDGQIYIA